MFEGHLVKAMINAVLALYGQPEPEPTEDLGSIADRLNKLSAVRRANNQPTRRY